VNILVTGANGFVGTRLMHVLPLQEGVTVKGAIRRSSCAVPKDGNFIFVDELGPATDWFQALQGISEIVHTAARVHVMNDKVSNPLEEFRRVNVDGTLNLARQAAAVGVKRFVFLSSIKVNGEETAIGHPFTAEDLPAPQDPYGLSKFEAEQALLKLALETKMEVVIIRPVLVYGPGVKANFKNMMKWVYKGIPMPLGSIHNQRSLVSLENLCDLIICCLKHPGAANQVFLVSDGQEVSTTQMLTAMARAMNTSSRLLPVPQPWLNTMATIVGKQNIAQRLFGSLVVDISKNKNLLGWSPPYSLSTCFEAAALDFIGSEKK
jgi:nucleoside-diphosphate-sugar epimerase